MGTEEKKEEVGAVEEQKKVEETKEEKKEDEIQEIVIKVDMHCEACARKVARSLKGFQGVIEVTTFCKASKVVVKGKNADPLKVCERIKNKYGRKVQLISPLTNPPQEVVEKKEEPPLITATKTEPPPVITVKLQVQMHCDACAQALRKRIRKIKGVESVTTDLGNNQVVVKGVVDPEKLASEVCKRTGKQALVVPEEVKKEEVEKKDEEKKDEEKKEKVEEAEKKGDEEGKGEDEDKTTDIKKSECMTQQYDMEYANYVPQFFSDENPHACTVM